MRATDHFIAEAERAADARRADAAWVTGARRAAIQRFAELGLPTTRDEEWRFTSIAPIADTAFSLPANGASRLQAADVAALQWDGDRSATLVFVNGRYVAAASELGDLPRGVRVENLATVWTGRDEGAEAHLARVASVDRRSLTSLNTAFLADGAIVVVPDGAVVAKPIHLLFLSAGEAGPTMTHPRVFVVMGANSEATVVESYGALGLARPASDGDRYFTNTVTELVAGENATLTHYKIQREHPDSFHMGAMYLRV